MLLQLFSSLLGLSVSRVGLDPTAWTDSNSLDFSSDVIETTVAMSGSHYHTVLTGTDPFEYKYDLHLELKSEADGRVYEICGPQMANVSLETDYATLRASLDEYAAYSVEIDDGAASIHPYCDSPSNIVVLLDEGESPTTITFKGERAMVRASFIWEFWSRLLPERARAAVLNHATTEFMAAYILLAYANVWVPLYIVLSVAGCCLFCCVHASGSKSRLLSALLFYPFPFFGLHRLYLRGCCQFILYVITLGGLTFMPLYDAIALPWLVRSTGRDEWRK